MAGFGGDARGKRNPKSEGRNPKEGRSSKERGHSCTLVHAVFLASPKTRRQKCPSLARVFRTSDFGIRTSFGLRISALGFTFYTLPFPAHSDSPRARNTLRRPAVLFRLCFRKLLRFWRRLR